MEDQIFFNEEWNPQPKESIIEKLKEHQQYYNYCLDKANKLLEEHYQSEEFQNRTFLPKDRKHDN